MYRRLKDHKILTSLSRCIPPRGVRMEIPLQSGMWVGSEKIWGPGNSVQAHKKVKRRKGLRSELECEECLGLF